MLVALDRRGGRRDDRRDGRRRGAAGEPAAGVEGLAHGPGDARWAMSDPTGHDHEETALARSVPASRCRRCGARRQRRSCKKVDRNLEPESYESYRKLIDIQPDGSKKESVLYTMKKGRDKVVALFLAPPSDKGRVTLRLGDNMWLYIPDVGRADPHHQPAVGDRQRLQQRRHPAHRLHRGVQRGGGRRAEGRAICCRSRPRPAKSPTTGSRCGSTSRRCCR